MKRSLHYVAQRKAARRVRRRHRHIMAMIRRTRWIRKVVILEPSREWLNAYAKTRV